MILRVGDEVRYQLGGTPDLIGRVTKKMVGYPGVRVERGGHSFTVPVRDIVAVEVPVLTAKEREALSALAQMPAPRSVSNIQLKTGHRISGSVLFNLRARGFVVETRLGVVESPVGLWLLSDEGRRVVRDLGN